MKKMSITFVTFMVALVAMSQPSDSNYMINDFWDNWFISAGGGGNMYIDEHNKNGSFGELVAPALDISVGKWLLPEIGGRVQYAGLKGKGLAPADAPYVDLEKPSGELYEQSFKYLSLHGDIMVNASSLIGGYKQRTWEFVPFLGVGVVRVWDSNPGFDNELAITTGLLNKINLSDNLDLNLELRGTLIHARVVASRTAPKGEGMGSATIGLTYKFNDKKFKKAGDFSGSEEKMNYQDRVAELEDEVSMQSDEIDSLNDEISKEAADKQELAEEKQKAVEEDKDMILPSMSVFFSFDSYKLGDKEGLNLNYIAKIIQQAGKKYHIIGSTDQIGSLEYNKELSDLRAKEVYKVLVEEFNVNKELLDTEGKGEEDRPFNKPKLNRVVRLVPEE